MNVKVFQKLSSSHTGSITVRINQELKDMFTKTLESDPEYTSQTQFFETSMMTYLESKGLLK